MRHFPSTVQGFGGAVANYGTLRLRNCLIVGNLSQTGGDGIWSSGATAAATVESATVADNNAIGLHREGEGVFAVTNAIIWGHTVDMAGFAVDGDGLLTSVRHSLFAVPDTMDGIHGCIIADPGCVNAAAGNYRLRNAFGVGDPAATSPAIDAGMNLAWMNGAKDLDGRNRIMKGLPGTTDVIVDIGGSRRRPTAGHATINPPSRQSAAFPDQCHPWHNNSMITP